jgi:hypothetical protein
MTGSFRALAAVLVLSVSTAPAVAQLKQEKHPQLGIASIERPRTFDPVPTQPGEEWVQLFYKERTADPKRRSETPRRWYPELRVLVIPTWSPTTGGGEGGRKKPDITSFATYVEKQLGKDWRLEREGEGKRSKDYETTTYELTGPAVQNTKWKGYGYTWESPGRTVAVLGQCLEEDYEEMAKLWKSVGDKLKLTEPTEDEHAEKKWERFYRHKDLSHLDYRIAVREALVSPWEAEDTDNFIVVYNTKDQPLLRKVMRDIEALRLAYMEIFPPAGEFDAVSTVRICKDKEEYMAYGGSARSAGYWNFVTEELVLYDAQQLERGKRPDDSDTFIVLYHEAFHQYIHYSTGELPPHSWFNEGYGDFFSGAELKGGKVTKIGVNPWRAWYVKAAVTGESPPGYSIQQSWVPWKDMIAYSQGQYYANGGPNYAQGWSMIYFLRTAPAVQENERWAAILPLYFETLKTSYQAELEERGNPQGRLARAPAGEAARKKALEVAFEGVDLDELEEAWVEFVSELDAPQRK